MNKILTYLTLILSAHCTLTSCSGSDTPLPEPEPEPEPTLAAEPGYILFSDGTWAPSVHEGKTPIAIIFSTSDPTAADTTLRARHPGCTHGLAVALHESTSPWQERLPADGSNVTDWLTASLMPPLHSASSEGQPIYKPLGYQNTLALLAYNDAPENSTHPITIAQELTKYRTAVPTPQNTSGWYIPSPAELSYLGFGVWPEKNADIALKTPLNKNIINQTLQTIPSSTPLTAACYWSTTEASPLEGNFASERAFNVYLANDRTPISASYKTWKENAHIRFIIAF